MRSVTVAEVFHWLLAVEALVQQGFGLLGGVTIKGANFSVADSKGTVLFEGNAGLPGTYWLSLRVIVNQIAVDMAKQNNCLTLAQAGTPYRRELAAAIRLPDSGAILILVGLPELVAEAILVAVANADNQFDFALFDKVRAASGNTLLIAATEALEDWKASQVGLG